jgi:2',3'-cyclic-nucleotide 2'-phosphodiesterase (5'-nucleotidase family)
MIPIDSTTDVGACQDFIAFLQPFKEQLAEQMTVVIGQSAQQMQASRPESLLTNFSADMLRSEAETRLNMHIDIAIMNRGGLRTDIPQGDISVGNIYELMPFENELVIIWLRGDKLGGLLNSIASNGGEGVSGIRMGIQNGEAVNPTINGEPLDLERLYVIATSDFLAEGNDRMTQLTEREKMELTGVTIRQLFLEHIENETAKGNKINSQLDGRIYEIK